MEFIISSPTKKVEMSLWFGSVRLSVRAVPQASKFFLMARLFKWTQVSLNGQAAINGLVTLRMANFI